MTRLKRIAILIAALAAASYLAAVTMVWSVQDKLQIDSDPLVTSPDFLGLTGVEVVSIKTPRGLLLNGWYTPARPGMPTVLFLHGKGGNIGHRPRRFSYFSSHGYGVLFFDYRGFGGNPGKPSEQGLLRDAIAAYDWLRSRDVSPANIVVVAESLGTGVAVMLAASRTTAALALEAPYSSMEDIAKVRYWWAPVSYLIRNRFPAIEYIGKVHVPILMIHGEIDRSIPIRFGRKLFAAANEPKTFIALPDAGHDIFDDRSFELENTFFKQVFAAAQ